MSARPQGPRLLTLAACLVAVASCATVERVTQAAKPVKYRLAGADIELRKNLDRGLTQLKGENHRGALVSLNRALWDLERIEKRWLRLEDLAETHQALADVYAALRKPAWAEAQRKLSLALIDHARRDAGSGFPEQSLARAKEAYASARFREAVSALGQALVHLEDVTDTPARVRRLEEARCYLAFTHFALDEEDRVRDEIERLWTLDASLAFCRREAPPGVRPLIGEVQKRLSAPRP